jgi:hypothetical protein
MAFRQFEVSDTWVFDRPQAGRMWFEGVIRDHLDVGRPDQIALIFQRRVDGRTPGRFRTRVITRGVDPILCLIGHCAVTNVELNVVRLAKAAGARVALLTAHPENEHGELADLCVRVPGQIFGGPEEVKSIQPMASLLEQALFLFTDIERF